MLGYAFGLFLRCEFFVVEKLAFQVRLAHVEHEFVFLILGEESLRVNDIFGDHALYLIKAVRNPLEVLSNGERGFGVEFEEGHEIVLESEHVVGRLANLCESVGHERLALN